MRGPPMCRQKVKILKKEKGSKKEEKEPVKVRKVEETKMNVASLIPKRFHKYL